MDMVVQQSFFTIFSLNFMTINANKIKTESSPFNRSGEGSLRVRSYCWATLYDIIRG